MRINTNVSSLYAQRTLSSTNDAVTRSIGRLSSGFRITRAADDAAGLSIANKIRADVRSLKQASRNAEQANSLLQIAEGAAQTIGSIVDRLKELATQAASDNVDAHGRGRIKAEWDQLLAEITRTVDTTKFQGSPLLKLVAAQDAVDAVDAIDPVTGVDPSEFVNESVAVASGTANDSTVTANGTYTGGEDATITIRRNAAGNGWESSTNGTDFTAFTSGQAVAGVTFTIVDGGTPAAANTTFTLAATAEVEAVAGQPAVPASEAVVEQGGPRSFLVSSSGSYLTSDLVTLGTLDLTTSALGLDTISFTGEGTAVEWRVALSTLDDAISHINGEVGKIGAAQNRIEFAAANVRTTIENMAAAESTIRDADMAAEMADFTRNQILQQAGTAMLAQANSAPQMVLRLLQ